MGCHFRQPLAEDPTLEALGLIQAKTFVMPISEDMFFPVRDCQAEQKLVPDSELRVIESEAGLVARRLRFLTLCSGPDFAHTYPNGDRIDQVAAVYQALEVDGDPRAGEQESLEVRYFDLGSLPTSMEPLSERLLARALEAVRE